MYKNNSRNGSKYKGCSPLQLSCNLTGKCRNRLLFLYEPLSSNFMSRKNPFWLNSLNVG
jgi:hypothetical protein